MAVTAIGGYNLAQNFLIPAVAYVPANLAAGLGLIALARGCGCSWDDLGLEPTKAASGWRAGVVGAAMAAIAGAALAKGPRSRRYLLDQRAAGQRGGEQLYRTLIRYPLGTALFEEVAFRGVIYGIWRRTGATRPRSSLATAVTFGIWHLIPARRALAGNPLSDRLGSGGSKLAVVGAGALLTSLSSLGFSWLRERSESLVAPVMVHAAINGAGYLAGVAAWRRPERGPLVPV